MARPFRSAFYRLALLLLSVGLGCAARRHEVASQATTDGDLIQ